MSISTLIKSSNAIPRGDKKEVPTSKTGISKLLQESNASGAGLAYVATKPEIPKPTISKKIDKIAAGVTDFFGGKQLSEYIGAKIAKSRATEQEKQFIESPTAKQALASAGELALNIATLPVGGAAVKGALAVPKAIKYGKLALEGAGLVGASTGLRSVAEGADVFSKETGKATLKGATLGAISGPVLGILGEGAANLFGKKLTNIERLAAASKRAPYTIPEAGVPPAGYLNKNIPQLPAPRTPSQIPIELPAPGVLKAQQGVREFLEPKVPETIPVKRGKGKLLTPDVLEPLPPVQPQVQKTLAEMTPAEKIDAYQGKPIIETPSIPPVTPEQTPEIQARVEKIANQLKQESLTVLTDFEHQTNKQQIEQVLQKDPQHIIDVAMGKIQPEGGIPNTAYLGVAENLADDAAKAGDFSLVDQLSQSNVGRKAGQTLQALQIAAKDSLTGIVRDIRTSLEDSLPSFVKKNKEKELNKIRSEITRVMDSFEGKTPSIETILSALKSITCK